VGLTGLFMCRILPTNDIISKADSASFCDLNTYQRGEGLHGGQEGRQFRKLVVANQQNPQFRQARQ
jgi:hypothetical protein